jgi:hypothetical protein
VFERYEKNAPKFVPNSNYHKEEDALKPIKTHYPSNPKSSFNPKREVRKESTKLKEKAFMCIFYGRAGDLDEFYFCRKRVENMRFEYDRNSYRDEFLNFLSRSYSRASPRTSSRTLSQFSYETNHRSYSLIHERTALWLDALVTTHVLIVVIVSPVGLVFLLDGLTLTLSRDTWTVHVFSVVAHVLLGQIVRCKGM